jgi:hypothetical protein
MPTVNQRTGLPQGALINGIDAGGAMSARINEGYDNIISSDPDGLQVPVSDREVQFVRGTVVTQDWIDAVALLTGTVGTYVFYERRSAVAEATGFIKHTITAPVIHRASLDFSKGRYGTLTFDFECRAADPTKTIADMHAMTDTLAAPTYVAPGRGGYRVTVAQLSPLATPISIYHVTSFNLALTLPLVKECNDADVAYTCVDARLDGLTASGSITFQDSTITSAKLKAQDLLLHARADLKLTLTQSGGATAKTLTVAGVVFDNIGGNADVTKPFSDYTMPFRVANDLTTQLTLAGTNKILVIADAA